MTEKCPKCGENVDGIELLREAEKTLTDTQKEKRIDDFLAGWGGLKESRSCAIHYLEVSFWDVSLAQNRYWREVILMQDYA
jgi:hypothetical protein